MISKGRKAFTVLLVIIIIATVVLLGYLAYYYISNYFNKKEAAEVVDEFENIITVAIEDEQPTNTDTNTETNTTNNSETRSRYSGVRYRGYNVIGTITIPKTGTKYPIVDDTTPAAMDSAIVMLYGPGLNEAGNSVIVGHNYRNGGFFGSNKKLVNGDIIYITDALGRKIEYTVYNKYETTDMDFSYATRPTNGIREISLSTCTNNSAKRLIVWAKEN